MTVMLNRLEEAGLIKRTVKQADRREKFVKISGRGRKLLQKIWKDQPAQLESIMAGLDDNERLQLAQLLNRVIATHQQATESISEAPPPSVE